MLGHAAGRGCGFAQQQVDGRRRPLPPWSAIAEIAEIAAAKMVADLASDPEALETLRRRFLSEAERWYERKRAAVS